MAWRWKLIVEQCTGCGVCADVCPHAAIHMPREVAYPQEVPGACVGCGICLAECPFDAVEIGELAVG